MDASRPQAPKTAANPAWLRHHLFAVFVLSGFSGLIYESVWSHYLKLVLGHAAYAQTLVLALFMGGMALGALLASRRSERIGSVLAAYALVEGLVGAIGLVFHDTFTSGASFLYGSLIPAIGHPLGIQLTKFLACSLLILPQSVLLGATFPLMSVGVIRLFPALSGSALSLLYFTNSLGAALGVLVSGFVLIPRVGLPGTILVAGALNIVVALAVWPVARAYRAPVLPKLAEAQARSARRENLGVLLVSASLITGVASFFYEVGWIRMLSLVLGTTNQAFELMLSAFITGLALGSLYVRRRIERIASPLRFAGYVQVLMAFCALLTVLVYDSTFELMSLLLQGLAKNDVGYALFHLTSHSLALALMLPATFMAGMTLPLFTFAALGNGGGEASVGRIYAANTVGAIVGVLLAVHVVMPGFGTKWLIGSGALIDAALGLYLLHRARQSERPVVFWAAALAVSIVMLGALFGTDFDPRRAASGVYRSGNASIAEKKRVTFHRDGKTATISMLQGEDGELSILTNGKIDAAVQPRSPVGGMDEPTMKLAGVIPLALRPDARKVANIGFGSGITTNTMLATQRVERVDTIEIERVVIEAARAFGSYSQRAYEDPRSHIHIEDAKTFFSSHASRYDIIVSEPSNPWVSGTASLFSREFYRDVKRHLSPRGVLVQWLQLYETNLDNLASVFKALGSEFADYAVWNTNEADILIIASVDRPLPRLDDWVFRDPGLAAELASVRIHDLRDLHARQLGRRETLGALFETRDVPANSDFFPYLAERAVRSRYLKENAVKALTGLHLAAVPVLEALDGEARQGDRPWTLTPTFTATVRQRQARLLYTRITGESLPDSAAPLPEANRMSLAYMLGALRQCSADADLALLPGALHELAHNTNPFLTPALADSLWRSIRSAPCVARLPEEQRAWLALYHSVGARDHAAMRHAATTLLGQHRVSNTDPRHAYALTAGLLGVERTGDLAETLAFLGRFGKDLKLDETTAPELRLLVSMVQSRFARERSSAPMPALPRQDRETTPDRLGHHTTTDTP